MKKKTIVIILSVVLSLFVAMLTIITISQSPYEKVKKEAIDIVLQEGVLKDVEKFYLYNGATTYYTLLGKTAEGVQTYAIISQVNSTVQLFPASEVISETDVATIVETLDPESKLLQIRMGLEKESPIWEVTYRTAQNHLGYYIISAQSGEVIKNMRDL